MLGRVRDTQINPTYGGSAGPVHNQIPQPDRAVDNTTIWAPDFSQSYYTKLLFYDSAGANSMRNYYKEQSSNRYTVNGDVTDWVDVPFNEANYGANYCGGIVCARTWLFVRDSLNAWYSGQIAAGKTAAQIDDYLKKFDVWDRYDYDGDGNFDEPDGYIDHFQSIHAGVGEETGGGAQGTNAIWSPSLVRLLHQHRTSRARRSTSSAASRSATSSYWVGDYTIEPENGGVGVFAHEFAHDLGLPDEYDTSGQHRRRRERHGLLDADVERLVRQQRHAAEGIGNRPFHMNGWDKFQLGWLNYEVGPRRPEVRAQARPVESRTRSRRRACSSSCRTRRSPSSSVRPSPARTSTTPAPVTTWTRR